MKKIRNVISVPIGRDIKKILLMTKLTVFLSLFFVVQLSANVYSQTKLSVDSKNRTVKEVLLENLKKVSVPDTGKRLSAQLERDDSHDQQESSGSDDINVKGK